MRPIGACKKTGCCPPRLSFKRDFSLAAFGFETTPSVWPDQNMHLSALPHDDVFFQQTRSFCQPKAGVGDESNHPPEVVITFPALSLNFS